jgi:hypothetical protein
VRYTLWHLETGNLIGDFPSEVAALDAVREEIAANDDAEDLVLQSDRGSRSQLVASGSELAERARREERPAAAG